MSLNAWFHTFCIYTYHACWDVQMFANNSSLLLFDVEESQTFPAFSTTCRCPTRWTAMNWCAFRKCPWLRTHWVRCFSHWKRDMSHCHARISYSTSWEKSSSDYGCFNVMVQWLDTQDFGNLYINNSILKDFFLQHSSEWLSSDWFSDHSSLFTLW